MRNPGNPYTGRSWINSGEVVEVGRPIGQLFTDTFDGMGSSGPTATKKNSAGNQLWICLFPALSLLSNYALGKGGRNTFPFVTRRHKTKWSSMSSYCSGAYS